MLDIFYKIFRIYLLILLIKIPLTLLLLNPRQKILFIKYWSKIQTFYLIIIGLFFLIGLNYLFLIVTLFLDYYYLAIKYKDEKTKSNIIFIAFISNFLFLIFFLTLFLILTVLSS